MYKRYKELIYFKKFFRFLLKNLLILILLLQSSFSFSQNNDRWVAGSSYQLRGKVVNYIIFVSTPGNSWSESAKSEYLSKIFSANIWLKQQAEFYNVALEIQNITEYRELILDSIERGKGSGNERVDWAGLILSNYGIRNISKEARKLKKRFEADNIQLIIIARGNGRPYSIRFANGMKKRKYYFESLILYENYNNGAPIPVSSVYAHEVLHLYGAWDLYKTYAQTSDRHYMASEIYPNDIMHRVDHDLNTLEIDKLTAYLIGWNKEEPEMFEWFRPNDFRK